MSTNNRVSATLSAPDKAAVLTAIDTIKSKLPFLVSLAIEERVSLRKTATKRQGYVADVADGVKAFPNAMPATFPRVEYLKDADLFVPLAEIFPVLSGLTLSVEDTLIQLGSELITTSDQAYGYLKTGARSDSNLKPVVEKIATAMKRKTADPKAKEVK